MLFYKLAFLHTCSVKVFDELHSIPTYEKYIPGSDDAIFAFAGFATGMFYKSTGGLRGAVLAGFIGSVFSVGYLNLSTVVYNEIQKKI